MKIIGKVVQEGPDTFLLHTEIIPGHPENVDLGEFLEEFENEEVIITIRKFSKRHYSKDDEFTEGGAPSDSR
ncbi:MAG: hypothetical protein ACFFCS_09645 [Candidatus Hodarchaeota archaeon]